MKNSTMPLIMLAAVACHLCVIPPARASHSGNLALVPPNPSGAISSQLALFTALPDLDPPAIKTVAIELLDPQGLAYKLKLVFSEAVDTATATNTANYGLDGSAQVLGAEMGDTPATVLLTTSPLLHGATYTLTINRVTDVAGNPIAPNTQTSF
jgi:hypothetical protein